MTTTRTSLPAAGTAAARPEVVNSMEIPAIGGIVDGLRVPGLTARLAVLRRHRRRRQVRAWGTRVAVLTGCIWVALVVAVTLVH